MRSSAHTVIVGAGIVGVSAAWELAKRGRSGILVIDQKPLFRTGGSTSHAPGGVFQNNPSRTVSTLAQWTVDTFIDVSSEGDPTYFPVSSLEIATTRERWTDLHRKAGYATSWGLDAQLLDPDATGQLLPHLNTALIYGSIQVQRDGIVRAVPTVERIARRAEALGVEFAGETALTGVRIERGSVVGVDTDRGPIACERVVLCAGIWGPLVGEMAGIRVPIQPCAHPYVRSAPLPQLRGLVEIEQPLWRHQDHSMYLWQDGDRLGVGSYRHEPHLVLSRAIRNELASPAELPFDASMMEPGIREAERLLPKLAGFPIEDRVYGMFSFTPDGNALIGEVSGTRGLWSAMAIWVTHSAGSGRLLAQLMEEGAAELDWRDVDVNRFAEHQATWSYVETRGGQQYREVYDIIHPRQQISEPRRLRRAPWYERQLDLGAVFAESNGWERPQWYEANDDLPRPLYGAARDSWSAQEWSPICASEHLATRSAIGLFDLSTFMRIELEGADALPALERLTCSRVDRPVGRVTYSLLLNERGGIESDVTIARLAEDRFMMMAGSASGPRDLAWVRRQTQDFERLHVADVTSAWCALGVWGPNAQTLIDNIGEGVALDELPPYQIQSITIAGIPVLAMRMSYVGENGLELHTTTEFGGSLFEAIWNAGEELGIVAAGGGAMDTLRLEAGYRALGTDLRGEYTPHEAGLGFAVDRSRQNSIGAAALASRPIRKCLTSLGFDDRGVMPLGKEPLFAGESVAGYVTSAGFGYTVGCGIAHAYLPSDLDPNAPLSFEYFGQRHPLRRLTEPPLPKRSMGTGRPRSA
jgi:glycine cleavage system aminomethyltransferase T/glycine/D-amino acid oxidase-like deaminating enzyme